MNEGQRSVTINRYFLDRKLKEALIVPVAYELITANGKQTDYKKASFQNQVFIKSNIYAGIDVSFFLVFNKVLSLSSLTAKQHNKTIIATRNLSPGKIMLRKGSTRKKWPR